MNHVFDGCCAQPANDSTEGPWILEIPQCMVPRTDPGTPNSMHKQLPVMVTPERLNSFGLENASESFFEPYPDYISNQIRSDELCRCLENILMRLECDEQEGEGQENVAEQVGSTERALEPMLKNPSNVNFWPSLQENENELKVSFSSHPWGMDKVESGIPSYVKGVVIKSVDGQDLTEFDYDISLLQSASRQPPEDIGDFDIAMPSNVRRGTTSLPSSSDSPAPICCETSMCGIWSHSN